MELGGIVFYRTLYSEFGVLSQSFHFLAIFFLHDVAYMVAGWMRFAKV
jgi:hypothetical protein